MADDATDIPEQLRMSDSQTLEQRRRQHEILERFFQNLLKKDQDRVEPIEEATHRPWQPLPDVLLRNGEVRRVGNHPCAGNNTFDIWEGLYRDSEKCRIRAIRGLTLGPHVLRRFEREAKIWREMWEKEGGRDFIVPLYGICDNDLPQLYMVGPWMENGDVNTYVKKYPTVNHVYLVSHIAKAIQFLHSASPPIIHGDIRSANIMVDDEGRPLLADFGLAKALEDLAGETVTQSAGVVDALRWLAPELVFGDSQGHKMTTGSDVWSFGMTVLEILTHQAPFAEVKRVPDVLMRLLRKHRPRRPIQPEVVDRGLDDDLWHVMSWCWADDPADRPSMDALVQRLDKARHPSHQSKTAAPVPEKIDVVTYIQQHIDSDMLACLPEPDLLSLMGDSLKVLQTESLNRGLIKRFLITCVRQRGLMLQDLFLSGVQKIGDREEARGGFADVWKGLYKGSPVALKIPNMRRHKNFSTLKKSLTREAIIWSLLEHPNIQPFHGIADLSLPSSECYALVAPWQVNGDLVSYLERYPDIRRRKMTDGVAKGLAFLHFHELVHADLRCENVLIDDEGQPRIADFGLARVIEVELPSEDTETSRSGFGCLPFMAPELLAPSRFKSSRFGSGITTTQSDVYAFAMTCYQTFAGRHPFTGEIHPRSIVVEVALNERRPALDDRVSRGLDDDLWGLMEDCWKHQPRDRPDMEEVLTRLGSEKDTIAGSR